MLLELLAGAVLSAAWPQVLPAEGLLGITSYVGYETALRWRTAALGVSLLEICLSQRSVIPTGAHSRYGLSTAIWGIAEWLGISKQLWRESPLLAQSASPWFLSIEHF